jgi:predicted metal-dependent phosphotriesterase family hydrolase
MANTPQTDQPIVRTVLGDISPAEVGFAHCHEHTFIMPGKSCQLNSDLLLDDVEKTTAELTQFHAAGGCTVVDAQPIGPERAPKLQKTASQRSGVNIIATTGLHRACFYEENHFRFSDSVDALADRFVGEITDGMSEYRGAEVSGTTDIRAGLLKFATEYHLIDDQMRRVAEAVATAHRRTGAPIITHAERGTCAMEQIELMQAAGVDPSAMMISHVDRNPDIYLHRDIAAAGAYLVYDGISRTKYFPDSTIAELITRMVEAGFGRRILLAMDMGPRTMWRNYGGGPGMDYLALKFLPKLRQAGLTEEQIDMLTTDNPAAALAFRKC